LRSCGKIAPAGQPGQTFVVHIGELIYRGAARAAPALLRVASPASARLRRGVHGRATSLRGMSEWAAAGRDPERPLVWLHAPSVGEALMAQSILEALRERVPAIQSAFTFFSPSAERVSERVGADWSGYLPWDVMHAVRPALDALQPSCIAFVRTEIWPVLGSEARRRGVPVLLLNAVLSAGSSRVRPAARLLLGPAYRRLDAIGAVTAADAARFGRLGVAADRVSVTGDARFDQVWRRVQALDRDAPLLRALRAGATPLLVAGSSWPADEAHLVPALRSLRADGAGWRAVVAPHEPSPAHVHALERRLAAHGLSHARLPDMQQAGIPAADVMVVDRVGVLADLYAAADAAYVGGGFGRAGLHSVVEPAALGVPVLYGPRHGNAQEAERLQEAGGGVVVAGRAALLEVLRALHGDADCRRRVGAAARAFVAEHVGGAARNAALIAERVAQAP
jgi:3-deoxy-D-manno-octulosonic-acid transferase